MESNLQLLIQAIYTQNTARVAELLADTTALESRWVLNQTPLHVAVSLGNVEIVRQLLEAGAYIEAKNEYGLTALYLAVIRQDVDMVRLLLEAGASSETVSKSGSTPYSICHERNPEIAAMMLQAHNQAVKDIGTSIEEQKESAVTESNSPVEPNIEEFKAMLNADRVAIAGADETVRPEQLAVLSREYPFVEWSILYDTEVKAVNRFPSVEWIRELVEQSKQLQAETGRPMNLSIHLCREAVRGLICGDFTPLEPIAALLPNFQRMQLNVTYRRFYQYLTFLPTNIRQLPCQPQIIIQLNGASENELVGEMLKDVGIDFAYLHDRSGGHGKATRHWLPPVGSYCGYAGGLNPTNLELRLIDIAKVTNGHRIYLDLESGVRDKKNIFVLDRAESVLQIAKDWIK